MVLVRKDSLILDLGLKGLEGLHDETATKLFLFFEGFRGIAEGMRNGDRRNDTVGSNREGNGNYGADVNNRETRSFDFLDHRCAATSTGASGRCKDSAVNSCFLKLLAYFLTKLYSVAY